MSKPYALNAPPPIGTRVVDVSGTNWKGTIVQVAGIEAAATPAYIAKFPNGQAGYDAYLASKVGVAWDDLDHPGNSLPEPVTVSCTSLAPL
jgi:hypothetical protein